MIVMVKWVRKVKMRTGREDEGAGRVGDTDKADISRCKATAVR